MFDMYFKIQSIVCLMGKFAIKRLLNDSLNVSRNKLFIIIIYHLILMKIVS